MRKYIGFMIIIITLLLIVACGSNLEEVSFSSKLNGEKEVAIKEKIIIHKQEDVEEEPLGDREDLITSEEVIVEKEEEPTSVEQTPNFTTEAMSGDFMSSTLLNIRKGPSTDYGSVGSLQPNTKAVASEKTTINGSTWYKITANSVTGWSNADYLVAYKQPEPEKATTMKESKPTAKKEAEAPKETPKETPKEEVKETPKEKPSTSVTPSAIEKAVIDLTNAERKNAGLAPLKIDNKLVASARAKSTDMATNNYFAHHSPTYGSAGDQISQFGVSFRGWAENIAYGQRSAEQVVTAWMNSEGHKKNILHPNMTHIGVGHDPNGNYWTQQFIYR